MIDILTFDTIAQTCNIFKNRMGQSRCCWKMIDISDVVLGRVSFKSIIL